MKNINNKKKHEPNIIIKCLFYIFGLTLFEQTGYDLFFKYKRWFKKTYKESKRFNRNKYYMDRWNVFYMYASTQRYYPTLNESSNKSSNKFSSFNTNDDDVYFDINDSNTQYVLSNNTPNVIYFNPLSSETTLPKYAHSGDACMDVIAVSKQETENYIEYGLGFQTIFGSNLVGEIRPRSSVSKYDLFLANSPATIDSNYRGEWKVRFKKLKENGTFYEVGDRVAQIKFDQLTNTRFVVNNELFNELLETEKGENIRGEGGFGSSGK